MANYKLYKWSIVIDDNPYRAPEMQESRLSGFRDGEKKPVVTSAIVSANGRSITTKSGSVYFLMDIDPEYLEWMNKNKIVYDPVNPVKNK